MGNNGKENGHSPRPEIIRPNERAAFSAMVQVVQEIDPKLAEKVTTLIATDLAYSNNGSGTQKNLASAKIVYRKFGELYGFIPKAKKPRVLKEITTVGNLRNPNCFRCRERNCEHFDTKTSEEDKKGHICTEPLILPKGKVVVLSRPKRRIITPEVNSDHSGESVLYGPLAVDAKKYFGTKTNGTTQKK